MGSRLIFRPFRLFRWSDEENNIERLNGLASVARAVIDRKIRLSVFNNNCVCFRKVKFYLANSIEETSEKNF